MSQGLAPPFLLLFLHGCLPPPPLLLLLLAVADPSSAWIEGSAQ